MLFRSGNIANLAFGQTNPRLLSQPQNIKNLNRDSLRVATNGTYDESFDHQAGAYDATWVLNDKVTLKYIGGYTDYFYDRTTEEDKAASKLVGSYNFYVLQENENYQHEIQVFWDPTENLTITSGAFLYHNHIDQRLDLYDPDSDRFTKPALYAGLPGGVIASAFGGRNMPGGIDVQSAKRLYRAGLLPLAANGTASFSRSSWVTEVIGCVVEKLPREHFLRGITSPTRMPNLSIRRASGTLRISLP